MDIYVVQQGDNIYSIADRYGVSVEKLIQDNGLIYPYNLVIGQTIVIAYPKQSHTVQEGDTLQSIADSYNVSLMQLLRNNLFLLDREYIYQGESLVISYNTSSSITTNGFAYAFIKPEVLVRNLPNLTYLSVFNYTATEGGDIIEYQDDTEIIKISKEFGVIPLLMLTTLSLQGVPNIEVAFNILLNEEFQERNINQFIEIIKRKGYLGLNIIFNYLNKENQSLYFNFAQRISNRLQQEGLIFLITINYDLQIVDKKIVIGEVDYLKLSTYTDGMIFLKLVWGINYNPPEPVSNIGHLRAFTDYIVASNVPLDKIHIGKPILGYDWKLPYIPDRSSAASLSINSALNLAYEAGAIIQFDEESQTPFYYYNELFISVPSEHVVWFIDARSIDALNKLISDYDLNGNGIWNIMIYYPQLWTIIIAQFDIIKLL